MDSLQSRDGWSGDGGGKDPHLFLFAHRLVTTEFGLCKKKLTNVLCYSTCRAMLYQNNYLDAMERYIKNVRLRNAERKGGIAKRNLTL